MPKMKTSRGAAKRFKATAKDAFNFDFQQKVHEDMRAHFSAYPDRWGLSRTDRNIDHRRVQNVETWLERHGHELRADDWQPGDIMTCRVDGRLPHIGLLSSRKDGEGRWKAIHNIGLGTREDSRIWKYGKKRRFRFFLAEHHPKAQQVLIPAFIMIRKLLEAWNARMGHRQLRPTLDRLQLPRHGRDHAL